MVDVAVHGLDKLRATFIAFEGRLADGKCRHEVERIQAPFSVDLVGSGFPGGELLVAGLYGGQVVVVLAFKVFEPGLEPAGIQFGIADSLEAADDVREDTRGLVLICGRPGRRSRRKSCGAFRRWRRHPCRQGS